MKSLLIFAVSIVILFSCTSKSCPEDELVATFSFSEVTKSLINYEDATALVFEDGNGNEHTFSLDQALFNEYFINCMFQPCTIEFGDSQCLNGEFESREFAFNNEGMTIRIRSYWTRIGSTEVLDEDYAEFISVMISMENQATSSIDFASNWNEVDSTHAKYTASYPDIQSTIVLINREYEDVFSQNNSIWLAEEYGVIGFNFGGVLFELKEIVR